MMMRNTMQCQVRDVGGDPIVPVVTGVVSEVLGGGEGAVEGHEEHEPHAKLECACPMHPPGTLGLHVGVYATPLAMP